MSVQFDSRAVTAISNPLGARSAQRTFTFTPKEVIEMVLGPRLNDSPRSILIGTLAEAMPEPTQGTFHRLPLKLRAAYLELGGGGGTLGRRLKLGQREFILLTRYADRDPKSLVLTQDYERVGSIKHATRDGVTFEGVIGL